MTYNIINRNTNTLWIPLITKTSWDSTDFSCIFFDKTIEFSCTYSLFYIWSDKVKNHCILLTSFTDSFYLLWCLNHRMVWYFISSVPVIFDTVIKRHMTCFIFLSAATPAFIISSYFHY